MKQRSHESPADLSSRFADLPPAKQALLRQRLKRKRLEFVLNQTIPRRVTSDPTQLSFAQQRLWFLDQYQPDRSVYNVSSALWLKGRLDLDAIKQSIAEVVRRHESLRTTFANVNGEPLQVIAPAISDCLTVIDLRDRAENEREDQARRLASGEARRPFDLEQGPLFRATLLRLDEADHILVLLMHHIVSDGWSMGVLHRELSILYQAFSRSQPFLLEALPIQYADYALWQRQWLQGQVLESELSYWTKQLQEVPAILDLPRDHPRPSVQSYRGARQSIQLSRELAQRLKALSQKEGVTLFMTLLAAFSALLYRYTGQTDIVVGSPIAGRNRTEIEGLIGFFVNTLVLRSDLSGNPTFRELLRRVRKTSLEAYEHQELPFEKLVEELKPERSLSHSPLFQVMFVLQNTPDPAWRLEGLAVSPLRITGETAKFDLTLFMQETSDALTGSVQYSTDLFNEQTILRLLGHFEVLLQGIVSNPQQAISALPLLTAGEKHRLLIDWNATEKEYPGDKCLHQQFESQVERSPDEIAVIFENQQLTYRELNARANQLAHYLQKHGVGPDVLVGICLERCLEMPIAILGILKAGGAYVPLDPEYPMERLAFMLKDAKVSMLLTQQRLLDRLRLCEAMILDMDTSFEVIARESQDNPAGGGTAKNLAYVIYTSGSTGRPKGVMITHQAICNRLHWGQEAYPLAAADRVVQLSSFSFDFSIWEFFGPLLVGARLVMTRPGQHLDSAKTIKLIADQKITTVHFVPSVLEIYLEDEGFHACSSLKRVFCGGENLPVQVQERFFSRLDADLYNQYGPTEACIDATFWKCKQGTFRPYVPIGRPIANAQIYLLDTHLHPVPVGVTGELYIGGVGLARGYLYQPGVTAEHFVPDPFSNEPGSRLYKTGDLARYLCDGDLEVLGRLDHQVKIRGIRIELEEIENVLREHASVRDALVVARNQAPGAKQLAAYVVPNSDSELSVGELHSFLKQRLPKYMLPSAFLFLDALPLMSNGKVDRKALPVPDGRRLEQDESVSAPRTPIEEMLADIWTEVLKLEKIGIHNNFFDLGGHSLLATQIVSRIRETLQIELPLRKLFEKPTIAELAELITEESCRNMDSADMSDILTELESMSDEKALKSMPRDS
jgi:amino acid adenylation domain-containing protein